KQAFQQASQGAVLVGQFINQATQTQTSQHTTQQPFFVQQVGHTISDEVDLTTQQVFQYRQRQLVPPQQVGNQRPKQGSQLASQAAESLVQQIEAVRIIRVELTTQQRLQCVIKPIGQPLGGADSGSECAVQAERAIPGRNQSTQHRVHRGNTPVAKQGSPLASQAAESLVQQIEAVRIIRVELTTQQRLQCVIKPIGQPLGGADSGSECAVQAERAIQGRNQSTEHRVHRVKQLLAIRSEEHTSELQSREKLVC